MLGAIIGDIVGSRFEFNNIKTKEFEFFHHNCEFTDDSVMTLAVAKAIMSGGDYAKYMREFGRLYPHCSYGSMFWQWLNSDDMGAYNSFGNGAAMRVSPCGFVAESLEEAKRLSRAATEVTHNHPEAIKGAEAVAVSILLARKGFDIMGIHLYINAHYYPLDLKLDAIRDSYRFDVTCQGTVPQAIEAFLESTSFEDAIRNAISIGGDSDTLAAITGGIAEAYYGIPPQIQLDAINFLDGRLIEVVHKFQNRP